MRQWQVAIAVAALSAAAMVAHAAGADPVVSVAGGALKGRLLPAGGATFKGIPFAQPPLGDLRWREPAPVKAWSGVRDAGAFGANCTQRARPTSTSRKRKAARKIACT
jgi:para-nitrobenzyl esterase